MFKIYLPMFLFLISFGTVVANDVKINFATFNINEARKKAGEEGKLLFIDFHAVWCTPCQWMDQTTFKDEDVANALNQNFVAVKVDIDNFDGYDLKTAYDVKYLPTMLIFNSQGQLLDRVEETLSPRKLLSLLDKYNAPEHRQIIKHEFNTSPSDIKSEQPLKESETMMLSAAEYKKYFTQQQSESAYKVQVGVFQRYEGAKEMVNALRQLFVEQISVTNEYKESMPIFKVKIGQFATKDEAEAFKKILKDEYNMDGIVYN